VAIVGAVATLASAVVLIARCCCSSRKATQYSRLETELDEHHAADLEETDPPSSSPSTVPAPNGRLDLHKGASDHLTRDTAAPMPSGRRQLPSTLVVSNLSLQPVSK
jgi:hypothetical protein